jgi:hypothetical protein
MLEQLKALFRKPTPLERAAKELGQIEHSLLDVDGEIMWAQKRKEYYIMRRAVLHGYIQGETK